MSVVGADMSWYTNNVGERPCGLSGVRTNTKVAHVMLGTALSMTRRPRPHPDTHRVASAVCPITLQLGHSILLSGLFLPIPLSIHLVQPNLELRLCAFALLLLLSTDTFLDQQRLAFTLTLHCLCIPGHIGAGPCFCLVFSTQTLVLHDVFRAFFRLGMCTTKHLQLHLTRPSPDCRACIRQLPACLLSFLVILPHSLIIHSYFSI
jgi:hypothetical protein